MSRSHYLAPHPPPSTALGIHRVLSTRAGIRVSPLCLGAMSIGEKWHHILGSISKDESFKLLDAFFEKGGNFIDTANNYQDETSEEYIGEWMEARGIRDQIVLATKYTTCFKTMDPSIKQTDNYVGNNTKSMTLSVKHSLRKLRTDYIDIFYVHWWDFDTSIEEVMDSLHNLVVSGKVLYLGISDTPAWVVSQANQYARAYGKTPFVIYQGKWAITDRSFEREIIPMARANGLALAPWGVIGTGKLRTDEEEAQREKSGEKGRAPRGSSDWKRTPEEVKISKALEKVAKEVGVKSITSVAIAYVMHKTTHVFPVIGGRKIEHLDQNIEALTISLTPEQIKYLENEAPPFDVGFPSTLIGDGSEITFLLKAGSCYQRLPYPQPLGPAKI
ncbi:arylalcohol dehydrogenase [Dendrothele bispora CBS 962.96]|uniref:Arylalcohol dehydrogenase n=1 Tax=Dendrothele bispora (strain CBS 962.96) TaxID=1314807 RepID=A0A4S8KSL8_DENBC|nr:arylalcohol dehydrogenase [Dendrothele bispora CBS 962.96]